MIRSPFPDVDIPDVPLTDFVLANAERLGDRPALIDATTDRTRDVRAAGRVGAGHGRRPCRAGLRQGRHLRPLRPEPPRVCDRPARGRDGRRCEHDRQPVADRGGARGPVARLRRADAGHRAGVARQGGRGRRAGRGERDLRVRRGRERDAVRLAPAIRGRAARGGDRSRERSRRAALFERHHGAAQGRDAHPSQPGREHLPDGRRASYVRGRPRRRRAAVLPHLRARRRAEHEPPGRRDAGDDAALRAPRVPEHAAGAPDHARLCRAADRVGAGQASARGRVRPLERGVRAVRRRTAVGRPRGGVRRPPRLPDAAGVRHDGGQPRHPPGGR